MAIQVDKYAPVLSMMKSGSLCMICRRDLSGPSAFNWPLVVSKLPQECGEWEAATSRFKCNQKDENWQVNFLL